MSDSTTTDESNPRMVAYKGENATTIVGAEPAAYLRWEEEQDE